MDILKIRFPIGTVVKNVETGEVLIIMSYHGNKVYFDPAFKDGPTSHDYWARLGTMYVKDKTAQVLYGNKRNNRITWSV